MTIVIDGTNGISGVDGTAANPAIKGNDSNNDYRTYCSS